MASKAVRRILTHPLFILLFCLFVIMTGYGITLPVLSFYIERFSLSVHGAPDQAAIQVGLLTGIFSLMQFIFAPLWGRWSDRVGRHPVFLIGLFGFMLSMIFFALATSLAMLYAARIIGGTLSAAILPISGAFVADMTESEDRARGMAWLGSATSLGIVVGPALGSFLSKWGIRHTYRFGYFQLDDFSVPFLAASFLAFLAFGSAMLWFPESLDRSVSGSLLQTKDRSTPIHSHKENSNMHPSLVPILVLAFLDFFALAIFEGTFSLHAKMLLGFGPFEMGWIFVICGLVMAIGQSTLVPPFITRFGEGPLLPAGFFMMGVGLALLMVAKTLFLISLLVALFALGVSFITPTLASMVSKRAERNVGKAMGQLTAVDSLGQAAGPVAGGFLIGWRVHFPYLLTSSILVLAAFSTFLFVRTKESRDSKNV